MTGVFVAWSDRKDSPGWVEDGTGCHIWIGAVSGDGYGHVWHEGKLRYVHRVRYEREVGPIPPGLQLDHYVCDRGHDGCCNPRHCRPATNRQNTLRSARSLPALNVAKTHCPRGHELSGDNLIPSLLKKGERACRTCFNASRRERYVSKRARPYDEVEE